jgi:SPP1 family predicted phage head-tail adaptor
MTATFNPGQANQRIRLQAKSVTRNAIGEEVVAWTDVVTDTADHALWAEAWPLKGREFFAAQQTRYAADVRFRIGGGRMWCASSVSCGTTSPTTS